MKPRGFTLIELVLVIVVLSILAVNVAPRLFPEDEFEPVTQRDRLIALLRTVQQRAMQNTENDAACFRVLFQANDIGLATENNDGSCANVILPVAPNTDNATGITTYSANDYLQISEINNYTALNAAGGAITFVEFDNLGRPIVNNGNCDGNACQVSFAGRNVCIESEGYIHGC